VVDGSAVRGVKLRPTTRPTTTCNQNAPSRNGRNSQLSLRAASTWPGIGCVRCGSAWRAAAGARSSSRGGPNGKVSTVRFLTPMLVADCSFQVSTPSPPFSPTHDPCCVRGEDSSKSSLVASFRAHRCGGGWYRIDLFRFGTLAALWIFSQVTLCRRCSKSAWWAPDGGQHHRCRLPPPPSDHDRPGPSDWLGQRSRHIGRYKA